jgi:hypothetical protein
LIIGLILSELQQPGELSPDERAKRDLRALIGLRYFLDGSESDAP